MPGRGGRGESVLLELFPEARDISESGELLQRWERLQEVRRRVNKVLEEARKEKGLGQSLAAKVTISADESTVDFLKTFGRDLESIFIVSEVELVAGAEPVSPGENFAVTISAAAGEKCERCWGYVVGVGKSPDFPGVCPRCAGVLGEIAASEGQEAAELS
jgi:isoleucyl-tRNA synthetase